jgi:predicted AAA+ superfamily ATPase
MDTLIELFEKKLALTNTNFFRSIIQDINWNARLIGIKGARGVGKTTLLLQYIKLHLHNELDKVLYVTLDNIWFSNNTLIDLVRSFEQRGGKYLFLDEVHKYNHWAQELKNIYDDYPDLKIVFTGSSLLEILNARADLSRRAITYYMQGLSFREYLTIESGETFQPFTLNELLKNHIVLARTINDKIKPFRYFENYLKNGYYPYYQEEKDLYLIRLGEVINMMLDIELPLLRKVDVAYVSKIKQLLVTIAEAVPFQPNVSKLSNKININRNTLLTYFHYLEEIGLTKNLFKQSSGISTLQKPLKTYLENTNIMYLLAKQNTNKGNLRETFFVNQVGFQHSITYAEQGDFKINDNYIFEVGGKNKTHKQLKNINNAYTVIDDISIGSQNRIPLWMFGFLY